ncbi:DUF6392 family protein [Pseudomonas extremaustralis]|uniref:Pyocin immunity protein n=2 Tax=Pseudomonas extremaustralis TaxID=359110 RepID=A0A5C5QP67_9PSED|nr:DUF6392 family protein [Pseudomonas extremaustralis]EZI30104.1 pyocin immunity protein [Pseudomonas extremaustralis 14-3 substr. 14-3b]TWS07393.1 pyocin immunity protein [Pseudomonas extremaustralis]
MNAAMIDDLVKSLGRTYPELIASGMYLPGGPPKGMFEGDEQSSISPAPGIDLGFSASQHLESLYIYLHKVSDTGSAYAGSLPYRLQRRMNQAWVRSHYGEPLASKAPFKMPVLGMTGGWDTYHLPSTAKNIETVFQYNAEMEVKVVVLSLVSLGT